MKNLEKCYNITALFPPRELRRREGGGSHSHCGSDEEERGEEGGVQWLAHHHSRASLPGAPPRARHSRNTALHPRALAAPRSFPRGALLRTLLETSAAILFSPRSNLGASLRLQFRVSRVSGRLRIGMRTGRGIASVERRREL